MKSTRREFMGLAVAAALAPAKVFASDAGTLSFTPDLESFKQYRAPEWFRNAKLGFWACWGPEAVPEMGDWYARQMYIEGHPQYEDHLKRYGHPSKFGYKDIVPLWKGENWDPERLMRLYKKSGARYFCAIAQHHDNIDCWNSKFHRWNSVKMGPKRDTLGELAAAIRAQGLHFGLSSHRAEHNFFYDGGRSIRSDVNDPKNASLYGPAHQWISEEGGMMNDWTYLSPEFARDWLARDTELVEKYKPEVVYFDWWAGQPGYRQNVTKFAAFYYNFAAAHGYGGVIDIKDYDLNWKAGARDFERGAQDRILPEHWQTDTSISNASWGYIEHDTFKTPEFIVHQLVDIVSKNGNLLLNFGPKPDGTIPDEVKATLLDIGAWLKVNGEAIYATTPWKSFGEGPTQVKAGAFHDTDTKPYTAEDFRFTAKGTTVYAIGMACPADGKATIHSLGWAHEGSSIAVGAIELLGSTDKVTWTQGADALQVNLPAGAACKYAYTLKLTPAAK